MRKLNNLSKAAMLCGLAVLASCEENSLEDLLSEEDGKVAESYVKTEAAFSNIYSIVDKSLRDSTFRATDSAIVNGAVVLRNANNVSINFAEGVLGADGRTREGMIGITETGEYMSGNAALEIKLIDYKVDDNQINGGMGVSQNGQDFVLTVNQFSAGEGIEIGASKNIMWQEGFTTLSDVEDDIFNISGTTSGKMIENDRMLTSDITEALQYDRSCEYKIVGGVINLNLEAIDSTEAFDASLDFLGDDGCNNIVKVGISQGGSDIELTQQFNGF